MTTTPTYDPETLKRLQTIPNVGPAISRDLAGLGFARVEDLRGQDPDALYHELCRQHGACPDPCMHDVLSAVVAFANGEPSRPWWEFTPARKARVTPIAPPEMALTPALTGHPSQRGTKKPPLPRTGEGVGG